MLASFELLVSYLARTTMGFYYAVAKGRKPGIYQTWQETVSLFRNKKSWHIHKSVFFFFLAGKNARNKYTNFLGLSTRNSPRLKRLKNSSNLGHSHRKFLFFFFELSSASYLKTFESQISSALHHTGYSTSH